MRSAPLSRSFPRPSASACIAEYGLSEGDAATLTATQARADLFESEAKKAKIPKRLANLVISELQGRLKAAGLELEDSPITMAGARLSADLLEDGHDQLQDPQGALRPRL